VFGWQYDDQPAGEGIYYSMARLNGRAVAAISPLPREQESAGIPPHWNCYVTVEDADETAGRAEELGGTVFGQPFDVFTAGRMAAIGDPQGGTVLIWQPGDQMGAELVNAPGARTWDDLTTPDPDGASRFYGDLFGWTYEEMDTGGGPRYLVIKNGDRSNGGILEQPDELRGARPFWTPYFGVDDVSGAIGTVEQLGGSLVAGPIKPPAGEFAVVRDPQGAAFAVWAGTFDD
jgi:uncharacterized protein